MVLAVTESDAKSALHLLNGLNLVSKAIGKVEPKKAEDNSIHIKLN
jgi:phosphoribosylaminoimidazole (AIR) synthetase